MRRLAVAAAAVLLLAGCSDDDEGLGEKPDLPDETPALWNPCDALDPALVKRLFGSDTTEESGTPTQPECRFAPEESSGGAVVTASYLQFTGTLEEAWDTMGQPEDAAVTEPRIPGSDSARIVVDVVRKQLYVTGFVENGDLIQSVNVVDPAPYDEKRGLAGVREVLTVLSQHAVDSGVNDTDESDEGEDPPPSTPPSS
jgi:hypothetical protein